MVKASHNIMILLIHNKRTLVGHNIMTVTKTI